jgi:cystathionine beta-lyase/cystathionine gamma-synthase
VADRLLHEKSPLRRAFGQHMKLIARAMREIEWVDSGDKSSPADIDAIKAVFEETPDNPELRVLLADARALIEDLRRLGA